MSKNQFTGTATQRNRNATANFVNLMMTSTVSAMKPLARQKYLDKLNIHL